MACKVFFSGRGSSVSSSSWALFSPSLILLSVACSRCDCLSVEMPTISSGKTNLNSYWHLAEELFSHLHTSSLLDPAGFHIVPTLVTVVTVLDRYHVNTRLRHRVIFPFPHRFITWIIHGPVLLYLGVEYDLTPHKPGDFDIKTWKPRAVEVASDDTISERYMEGRGGELPWMNLEPFSKDLIERENFLVDLQWWRREKVERETGTEEVKWEKSDYTHKSNSTPVTEIDAWNIVKKQKAYEKITRPTVSTFRLSCA